MTNKDKEILKEKLFDVINENYNYIREDTDGSTQIKNDITEVINGL